MKKIVKYSCTLILLFSIFSCQEEVLFADRVPDGIAPGEVEILEIIPSSGKVIVKWILPQDEDFHYVKIIYNKNDSEERILTYSKFNSDSIIISNLSDIEYNFTFKSVDISGSESKGISAKAKPLTPAYKIAAETVSVTSTIGAIIFSWDNPSQDTLLASVYLETANGDSLIDIKYTGSVTNFRVASMGLEKNYYLEFRDPEQNTAISERLSAVGLEETQFDRKNFSSDFVGYSPFTRVFDGQYDVHFATGGPFPRTIDFSYQKPIILSRFLFYVSRHSTAEIQHQPQEIEIWTSLSGDYDDFSQQGSYTLKEVEADLSDWYEPRNVILENTPECQYIKLVVKSTYSNQSACVIGEIEAFGADVESE